MNKLILPIVLGGGLFISNFLLMLYGLNPYIFALTVLAIILSLISISLFLKTSKITFENSYLGIFFILVLVLITVLLQVDLQINLGSLGTLALTFFLSALLFFAYYFSLIIVERYVQFATRKNFFVDMRGLLAPLILNPLVIFAFAVVLSSYISKDILYIIIVSGALFFGTLFLQYFMKEGVAIIYGILYGELILHRLKGGNLEHAATDFLIPYNLKFIFLLGIVVTLCWPLLFLALEKIKIIEKIKKFAKFR